MASWWVMSVAIARRVSAGKRGLANRTPANAAAAADVLSNVGFDLSTGVVQVSARATVDALGEQTTALGDVTSVIHAAITVMSGA